MPITKTQGKKDGLQRYRVRVNYTDSQGKQRRIERIVYGLPEAKETERRLVLELTKAPAQKMTVADLCAEYLDSKKNSVRASSLAELEKQYRLRVVPYIGKKHIAGLTLKDLQAWKNALNDTGLSVTTKKNTFAALRAAFSYAERMEYIAGNPVKRVGNFVDVEFKPHDEMQYYTPEQFVKYIAVAKDYATNMLYKGFYVFFCIAYYTGMRKGEINALKWTDIDGNTIKVRRSINQKATTGDVETPPKNRPSIRDIQMPEPLIDIIQEHKACQMQDERFSPSWRICGGPECLRDTSIDKANRKFAKVAGLPRIRIHDFRHSHASVLCNEGINIQEIARRLGHSNVQTTWQVYAHLYPREEERALQILNKIK
jgi:integrase